MQDVKSDQVNARKRGRPKRDNMQKYTIKMDKILYEKVAQEAAKIGTSNSFIISEGVRLYLK